MAKDNNTNAPASQPEKVVAEKVTPTIELELKPGEAIVSHADNDDEKLYFKTSLSDWNRVFSVQKIDDKPKYKLIAEKKS